MPIWDKALAWTHCGLIMPYGVIILINIGSGNGLLLVNTNTLLESMLVLSCACQLRAIALKILMEVISTIHVEITLLKLKLYFLGDNESNRHWLWNKEGINSPYYSSLIFQEIHLTHWGRDKMAAISLTKLSIAFSWIKMLEFRLNFHWSLFLTVQLTIFQHWFR